MARSSRSANSSRRSQRAHVQSRRLTDAMNNAAEERTAKEARQAEATERSQNRARDKEAAMTVEQAGDSDEIQQLRALIHAVQARCDAAEQELSTTRAQLEHNNTFASGGSASTSNNMIGEQNPIIIPRPSRTSQTSIHDIRCHMDLKGPEHDLEWARVRAVVREYLISGRIEWDLGWKAQSTQRLGKIYDAIEEKFPALRRFRSSWATEYLTRNAFNNHKTYETCKNDKTKYRGKNKWIRKLAIANREQHISSKSCNNLDNTSMDGADSEGMGDISMSDNSSDNSSDNNDNDSANTGSELQSSPAPMLTDEEL
ncbi:hypothetical protein BD779DRAFT_1669972 [Infundibulicybe gibba]|nr:hypothetical protein BD779DRAFT_1669972 [Infundibulicybe gibba]